MADAAAQEQVKQCLSQTVAVDREQRRRAEDQLAAFDAQSPGFSILLLEIARDEATPPGVRQAAAVYFKNVVKQRWTDEERPILDVQREQIKAALLSLMVTVPDLVQRQLSEALAIISDADFPDKWPSLLPELVQQLGQAASQSNWVLVHALLQTASAMFRAYRHEFKSDALMLKLLYVLDRMATPLLQLAQGAAQALSAAGADARTAGQLLQCLEATTQVHLSLCSQDLPRHFEDALPEWMAFFDALLRYDNHALAGDADDPPGPLEAAHMAVVETLALYASKYEEEFEKYVEGFTNVIWHRLLSVGAGARFDALATTSIRFLTSIATSVHHSIFAREGALKEVCEKIVLRNMRLSDADEEMFEDDPTEYIRRDIEGSDTDTRRRVCSELVRALNANYQSDVAGIVGAHVTVLLQEHSADPSGGHWKAKDLAMYLATALSISAGNTGTLGATRTTGAVDIAQFFQAAVLPELQAGASAPDALPVLKANAIKYVATFRSQLDKEAYDAVLQMLPALLAARSVVVHTYAAHCLERLLATRVSRDAASAAGGAVQAQAQLRLGPADVGPKAQALFTGLFAVLKKAGSTENEYAMKAIMRLSTTAGSANVAPVLGGMLSELTAILMRVAANPAQPIFNHYLFETVAVLVRDTCASTPAAAVDFENALFPPFQQVLEREVAEFAPYVMQIIAQLLETRAAPSPEPYPTLFLGLLKPQMWDAQHKASVPAQVRLLKAYVRKREEFVVNEVTKTLGIFQKLLATKATVPEACDLLAVVIECTPTETLAPLLGQLCFLLFQRYTTMSTRRYGVGLVHALGCVVVCHQKGPELLLAAIEGLGEGTFVSLFLNVWLEHATALSEEASRHVGALALVRLACETPSLVTDERLRAAWPRAVATAVDLLDGRGVNGGAGPEDGDLDEPGGPEAGGYAASYVTLNHAAERPVVPCADADVRTLLGRGLQARCAAMPGQLMPALQAYLSGADSSGALANVRAMAWRAQPPSEPTCAAEGPGPGPSPDTRRPHGAEAEAARLGVDPATVQ